MASIALFHSILGPRRGMLAAAERLRDQGHDVLAVDQYDGRTFENYDEAAAFVEGIGGIPRLMGAALAAVQGLPDGFLSIGFSNGGGMAEYVATQRRVGGVVMGSGALPLEMLGVEAWPAGVPAQIHYGTDDPFRQPGWAESVVESVTAAGADVELFEYPTSGHLFTDPGLLKEYDPGCADLLWRRVDAFCRKGG